MASKTRHGKNENHHIDEVALVSCLFIKFIAILVIRGSYNTHAACGIPNYFEEVGTLQLIPDMAATAVK